MRTLIVGGVGSGKTTLAKYLSEFFDIPVFSIDSIIYDENNKKRDEKSQVKLANKINRENKEFIIEGVLRDSLDFLLNVVDQIIFLDNMINWAKNYDRDNLMKKLSKYNKKLLIIRNDKELKVYYKYLEKNKFYL